MNDALKAQLIHDIRGDITAMQANIQLLMFAMKQNPDTKLKEYIERLETNIEKLTKHLLELVEES